ncbi:hypothetical protein CIK05_09055 [Bdellovibrio sp. qaytius]|nr:hypothetical protein CIK05_09055 [Bdellovibrio sp. qaytius]
MQGLISYYATLQSLVEVGLGSFLHAFHVPFSGHVLSLNQGLILTQACQKTNTRKETVTAVNSISIITAILKSLSPIGKRLTPMLAITMQGFLFSIGVFIFGNNIVGMLLGISLLSLWSFCQPLLFAYLFFGEKLFIAAEKLWLEIAEKLALPVEYGLNILIGFVILKIILSCGVAVLGWKYPTWITEKYFAKIMKYKDITLKSLQNKKPKNATQGALKDLLNPWMILSLALTITFMVLTEKSDYFQIFIYSLRVIAVAYLVFFILRAFPQSWIKKALKSFPTLAKTVDQIYDRAPESTEPKH